ncbi:hypothetical protein GCM10007916_33600 [Psychromonas marina]|uniref:DUF5329 domain-containing protein n=1 Tax=Psychromonas marina TaxID=88364 RepID=A0ABQ6E4P4_9GAMM|nr:DUF5329 domain-containing protein [Psychromonas marina]GLS92290.1 hypothetical protein GCM10007916_33600 [Psychromonas marina]
MNKLLLSLVLLFSSTAVFANTVQEINHLLNFVETTDCSYHRNGTAYNGVDARDHIQNKYDYYDNKIKSAEDFIKYSATKSMMSGKRYTIICGDEAPQFSADWLNQELLKYRTQLIEK